MNEDLLMPEPNLTFLISSLDESLMKIELYPVIELPIQEILIEIFL
jgi:hypothetical protein